jgi:hypothetical protein
MILLSIYSPNLMKGRQQTIVYLWMIDWLIYCV